MTAKKTLSSKSVRALVALSFCVLTAGISIDQPGFALGRELQPRGSRSANRQKAKPKPEIVSDIVEVAGVKANEPLKWRYVDAAQTPSREVIKGTSTNVAISVVTAPPSPTFIIGDVRSRIYYWPGCAEYVQLPMKKRVYFKSKKDAARAGYHAAKNCP